MTVIVNVLGADRFTMKSALAGGPMFPSITDTSWIDSVGTCASAAEASSHAPNIAATIRLMASSVRIIAGRDETG